MHVQENKDSFLARHDSDVTTVQKKRFTVLPVEDHFLNKPNQKSAESVCSHQLMETSSEGILISSVEHQNLRPILKKRVNSGLKNIGECQTDITAVNSIRVH
jgi:hypothetical protein